MAFFPKVLSVLTSTFVAVSMSVVASAPAASAAVGAGSKFVSVAPTRVMDTRIGLGAPNARPAPFAVVDLQVAGVGGIPLVGATAVVLNLTITGSVTAGYVQALPTGMGVLGASSNMNLDYPGQTVAALVTIPTGTGGRSPSTTCQGGI